MFARIVGRDAELAAVRELLDDVSAGPSMLALRGEAGIGKTTVWELGIAHKQRTVRSAGIRGPTDRPDQRRR
jgi:hypothetical protein